MCKDTEQAQMLQVPPLIKFKHLPGGMAQHHISLPTPPLSWADLTACVANQARMVALRIRAKNQLTES